MCEKEEEDFAEMCESMQKLVVHVHECVCAFFEEASLHAIIGNVFVEEQELAVGFLFMFLLTYLKNIVCIF